MMIREYEFTTTDTTRFEKYVKSGKVSKDSVYDFTFDNRFYIYHTMKQEKYRYVAIDKTTGLTSFVATTKAPIDLRYIDQEALLNRVLFSIKYTGDYKCLPNEEETEN